MARHRPAAFDGTERFELVKQLGAGTFGSVYQAVDRRHGEHVALKVLARMDPDGLYRFKREFRALADLRDPNLVSLYELASHDEHWFFTMELVRGVPFDRYAGVPGGGGPDPFGTTVSHDALTSASPPAREAAPGACGPPGRSAELRLRRALEQLVRGVRALHAAGKLHRDIKPSNVLVTDQGRVVVLDFGMITELGPEQSVGNQVLGTVAYMAPEQAACEPLTPAADWYSVGVLLFQVLSGRLPHEGSVAQILLKKVTQEAPSLAEQVPGLPTDLCTLCQALLSRDPNERPSGGEILRALGHRDEQVTGETSPTEAPLVGRDDELELLGQALAACGDDAPRVVLLHGDSGVGKSALVATFLDGLEGQALVLRGRCYDRESVPYKAVDGLVDALSHHLRQVLPHEVAALLPAGAAQLAQLFPVLRRIPLLDGMAEAFASATADPQEQRQECFDALRGLMIELCRQGPVVLYVDDLQWGDLDSARLLLHLLRPPAAPPLLLLGTYRAADQGHGPFMAELMQQAPAMLSERLRDQPLLPLPTEAALDLARALVGDATQESISGALAREAAGNPFFICELARHLLESPSASEAAALDSDVTLERMLSQRMARLPAGARSLLEVVAVAGQPLEDTVACQAAAMDGGESAALELLRAGRLIRAISLPRHGAAATDNDVDQGVVATYHDRIRETLVAQLDADLLARHHLALARAMEAAGVTDRDEAVAAHFEAGGAVHRAATFTARAAERAAAALAFDHAARLFQRALDLSPADLDAAALSALRARLAVSLTMAGRGVAAAPEYLAAAEVTTDPDQAHEWRRCAAEVLLRSGRYQQGMAVLVQVLEQVGLKLPRTHQRAMFSMALRRAQLRLRGLGFAERSVDQLRRQDLARIDACWTVVTGLAFNDTIRSSDFQVRHLLLALKTGEPYRVARALAIEGSTLATIGASHEKVDHVYQAARELAQRLEHPHVLGLVEMSAGFGALMQGRFGDVQGHCDEANRYLKRWPGTHWEQGIVAFSEHLAQFYLGDYNRLTSELPRLITDCEQRGDHTLAANLKLSAFISSLTLDRPQLARQQLEQVWEMAEAGEFNITHGNVVSGLATVDLYEGQPLVALQRLQAARQQMRQTQMMRVNWIRLDYLFLRGRVAVAASYEEPQHLQRACDDARSLRRQKRSWAQPVATALEACIAAARGDHQRVVTLLREVEVQAEETDIKAISDLARLQRAWYSGDRERYAVERQLQRDRGLVNVPNMAHAAIPLGPPSQWMTDHRPGSISS